MGEHGSRPSPGSRLKLRTLVHRARSMLGANKAVLLGFPWPVRPGTPQMCAWPAVRNKLQGALFPGSGEGECATIGARNRQGFEAGAPEILVEHADRVFADHVLWSGDGVGDDRH